MLRTALATVALVALTGTAHAQQGPPSETRAERRVIKTLQPKRFLKLQHLELSPFFAFVTNDPFINRAIGGGAIAYHPTEVMGVEVTGAFSPNLGEGDYKEITKQLIEKNKVSPDISRIMAFGSLTLQLSPIHGKIPIGDHIVQFNVFGTVGTALVHTVDDLIVLQCQSPSCYATENQVHPGMTYGGGFRVRLDRTLALKMEARSLTYIETVNSTTLEYKNNLILRFGASFFVPVRGQRSRGVATVSAR